MIWQKYKLRSLGNPIRTTILLPIHSLLTPLLFLQVSDDLFGCFFVVFFYLMVCRVVCFCFCFFAAFFLAEATYPHPSPLEVVLIQELDLILTGLTQDILWIYDSMTQCCSIITRLLYHSPPGRSLPAQASKSPLPWDYCRAAVLPIQMGTARLLKISMQIWVKITYPEILSQSGYMHVSDIFLHVCEALCIQIH